MSLLLSCGRKENKNNSEEVMPGEYFNSFQNYVYSTPNVDSALDCLRKLSSVDTLLLRMLLHDSFAQGFIQYDSSNRDTKEIYRQNLSSRTFNENLLKRISSDTTRILVEAVKPIEILCRIQNVGNDKPELELLTKEFIRTQLTTTQFYANKSGRYGLMIYQIVSKYPELRSLSDELFASIKSNLDVKQIDDLNGSSRTELNKRTWYRYIYASVNYIEAKTSKDIVLTEKLLKTASLYSPDLKDANSTPAYFYEMFFIYAHPKESFKDDYLTFIQRDSKYNDNISTNYLPYFAKSSTVESKVLSTLLDMALVNPTNKEKLKSYYIQNNTEKKSFSEYWNAAIDSISKKAPPISLKQIDNKVFSSNALKGKWILLDFWGSWCPPCRKEHPSLQNYYDSVITKNRGKISLLTIACKDKSPSVLKYMSDNGYTFPVAMSDNNIEDKYSISGYPTKILITPNNKYLVIPFGTDWKMLIKGYADI